MPWMISGLSVSGWDSWGLREKKENIPVGQVAATPSYPIRAAPGKKMGPRSDKALTLVPQKSHSYDETTRSYQHIS